MTHLVTRLSCVHNGVEHEITVKHETDEKYYFECPHCHQTITMTKFSYYQPVEKPILVAEHP